MHVLTYCPLPTEGSFFQAMTLKTLDRERMLDYEREKRAEFINQRTLGLGTNFSMAAEAVRRMESDLHRLVERSDRREATHVYDLFMPQRNSSQDSEMQLCDQSLDRASSNADSKFVHSIPAVHSPRQNAKAMLELCMQKGHGLHKQGLLNKAVHCYQKAHDFAMEIGDTHAQGRACYLIGTIDVALGQHERGKRQHERAAVLAEQAEQEAAVNGDPSLWGGKDEQDRGWSGDKEARQDFVGLVPLVLQDMDGPSEHFGIGLSGSGTQAS